jgi:predicted alpha/beta-fold hydrolase
MSVLAPPPASEPVTPLAERPWPAAYPRFVPRRWLSNAHVQTIVGNFLPRTNALPPATTELVEVFPARGSQMSSRVRCDCHWQPAPVRAERLTVLLLHGLEGSSDSQYVIGNANKLWRVGCNIIRMNMRNCGGTEKLTPTLYHSGLSGDVEQVLRHYIHCFDLAHVAAIGYSMGGNLVLKMAADLGADARLPQLRAVVGVSPAVDLGASADALHEPSNRIYERKFLRGLLKRFRRKAFLFPRAFDPLIATDIATLRQFDDRITALYSGFTSADDYYERAGASRVIDRIAVPTLILHAADDPFIRFTAPTLAKIAANPAITWLETEHGGHCAFLGERGLREDALAELDDGYWAELTALRFLAPFIPPRG